MAIDTEAKRRSVQAYTFGLLRTVATGSINRLDVRATESWLYAAGSYPGASAPERQPLRALNGLNHFYAGRGGPFNGKGLFRVIRAVRRAVGPSSPGHGVLGLGALTGAGAFFYRSLRSLVSAASQSPSTACR